MMARIGGRRLVSAEEEYVQRAESRRLKSSSGVQDVLLTSSLVCPAIIEAA